MAIKRRNCFAWNLYLVTHFPIQPPLLQDVSPPWRTVREAETVAPYAVRGNQWIGYDDQTSVKQKVEIRVYCENTIITTICSRLSGLRA